MGLPYNVSRIVDANGNLDVEAYRAYSPLFIPFVFVLVNLWFASLTYVKELPLPCPTVYHLPRSRLLLRTRCFIIGSVRAIALSDVNPLNALFRIMGTGTALAIGTA
jgi:hypothetical protein